MPPTPAATDAARRLLVAAGWFAASGQLGAVVNGQGGDPLVAAERATTGLAETLARWFGPYGAHALLARALARVRPAHPALGAVQVRGPLAPALEGLAAAAHAHGVPAAAAGMTAVLADVVDLLARMIGEDMALHLVDRSMEHPTPDAPSALPTPRPRRRGPPR